MDGRFFPHHFFIKPLISFIFVLLKGGINNMNLNYPIEDKVEFLIACVAEFAKAHSLNKKQAFNYIERYKGLDFIKKHYGVEHAFSFRDVVQHITDYCHRQGGALML